MQTCQSSCRFALSMPPVQTDFNMTLEAPEKPQAGKRCKNVPFFFTSKTFAQTLDGDTVSCRCFPVHAPLHPFFFGTTPTCLRKASHEAIETSLRRWPLLLLCQGTSSSLETLASARGGTSLMAWCPFARARWSWRSQALKFVKSMVRRLRRIRTLEVELTRVHGKKTGWTMCDFEPPPSATPKHVPSSAHAHQKQQRATEIGAIRTTTCDPMNISDWRRVIQEEWAVPAPAT